MMYGNDLLIWYCTKLPVREMTFNLNLDEISLHCTLLLPEYLLQLSLLLIFYVLVKFLLVRIEDLALVDFVRKESAFILCASKISANMHMQENSNSLVPLHCQSPLRGCRGVVVEEVWALRVIDARIKPAGGVEPEHRLISVSSKLGDCVLSSLFKLTPQRPHHEDRDRCWRCAGDHSRSPGVLALQNGWVFGIGQSSYRFD